MENCGVAEIYRVRIELAKTNATLLTKFFRKKKTHPHGHAVRKKNGGVDEEERTQVFSMS